MRLGDIKQAYSRNRPFDHWIDGSGDSAHRQLSADFTVAAPL